MVIAASKPGAVANFKVEIHQYFDITDLGKIKWLLGFEIRHNHDDCTIGINQCAYLESMAAQFSLLDSKPTYTPMEPGISLENPKKSKEMPDVPYKGSLQPHTLACNNFLPRCPIFHWYIGPIYTITWATPLEHNKTCNKIPIHNMKNLVNLWWKNR